MHRIFAGTEIVIFLDADDELPHIRDAPITRPIQLTNDKSMHLKLFFAAWVTAAALFAQDGSRWWKGNLHTHSFWSDGDDFPEMINDWYVRNGYNFLAISDHNKLHDSERWILIGTNKLRQEALDKYLARFGPQWVETREKEGKREVRLKRLVEYEPLFETAGSFLLIQAEEITDKFEKLPVHMNASNLREYIPPQGGASVREVMQNNVNAVIAQAEKTGQRILPHLNHPNFHWAVTAEDLAGVQGEKFFEVYNGHPSVHNEGDELHASTERIWDIALALRLASGSFEPLYGIAVDDSHHYHRQGLRFSNAGRGWIMVRAPFLTPDYLIAAMEKGDFYASSGVVLREIKATDSELTIRIEPREGAEFRTEFIGTRRGFELESEPVRDAEGKELPVTRRYSAKIGEVLARVDGPLAAYRFQGDELYVRARIRSTRTMSNPSQPEEKESAWTQPIFFKR